jgi:hypothetical protein
VKHKYQILTKENEIMRNLMIVTVAVLIAMTSVLQAAVIPGRWEMVEALKTGTPIIVTIKAGDRIECSLDSTSSDDLTVSDREGIQRKLPKAGIIKIVSMEEYDDPVWDGPVYGLGIGFGLGALVGVAGASYSGYKELIPVNGLLGAGIGGAIGYIADRNHKGNKVLFKAR